MRHRLEFAIAEEAAAALERMDRAEDAGEGLLRAGILLEYNQVAIEAIQVLIALDQEFFDDLIHHFSYRVGAAHRVLTMASQLRCWD